MENQNPLAAFDPQQPESSPELSNFLPDPDKATPVINEASNTNLAAHAAMFSTDPNQVVDNYKAVAGQMNQDGTSSVADNLIGQAQATEREKVKTVLPTLLADKTISDKDKLAALNSAFDADSSLYHPADRKSTRLNSSH